MAVKYGRNPTGGTYVSDDGAPNNASGYLDEYDPWKGTYTPPKGYEWDPVQNHYLRSPGQTGQRGGQEVSAFMNSAFGGNPLNGLMGALGGGGGATGGAAAFGVGGSGQMQPNFSSTTMGVTPGGGVGHVATPDTSGAENAAFASAKDKVGQNSRGALNALNDAMAGQGMLGSGAQVQGSRDIIQSGLGELGDVRRQQAVTRSGNALDLAKLGYQGDITQRGQDISAQEANARLSQNAAQLAFQRQQAAASQQMQMMQLAMSGLKGLYPSFNVNTDTQLY